MLSIFWNLFAVGIKWALGLFASQAFKTFLWTLFVTYLLRLLAFLGVAFITGAVLTPIFNKFLDVIQILFLAMTAGNGITVFAMLEYLGFFAGLKMLCAAYVFRFTYKAMLSFVPPVSKSANVNYS